MKLERALRILRESKIRLLKEDYDNMLIPVVIRKNMTKREFAYFLGLTEEEKRAIDELFPNFIYEFDKDFIDGSGDTNAVEISVYYRGEGSSWTTGAGWGETVLENVPEKSEVNDVVRDTLDSWIENESDYFAEEAGVTEEELPELLDKIYKIIVNRSGKDKVVKK